MNVLYLADRRGETVKKEKRNKGKLKRKYDRRKTGQSLVDFVQVLGMGGKKGNFGLYVSWTKHNETSPQCVHTSSLHSDCRVRLHLKAPCLGSKKFGGGRTRTKRSNLLRLLLHKICNWLLQAAPSAAELTARTSIHIVANHIVVYYL